MSDPAEQKMWEAALDDHVARFYAANPLPIYDDLPILERYQAQVIAETALPWINEAIPKIWQARAELSETVDIGATPRVALLTNFPGLVAMKLVLPAGLSFVSVLPHDSFESFLAGHPDNGLDCHVIYSCYFTKELGDDTLERAKRKHKLPNSEEYWIHCQISNLLPEEESGWLDLWRWNGHDMALIEPEFYTWTW
jgi:hypothetical protein